MQIPNNEIERIMQGVVDRFLIPKFKELEMNATGEWIDSLEVKAEENVGYIRGRDYSEYLVRGRRPNQDQSTDAKRRWAFGMANSNPQFKAWLNARGLTQYGVQIAYKIASVGTTWYEKGGSDLLEVLESQAVIEYVQNEITPLIRFYVTNQIQRTAQLA